MLLCMYSERMQILLSPEQRRLVEDEARRAGRSAAAVVREAIEARYRSADPGRRRAAFERMRRRRAATLPPEELEALLESRFDDELPSA